MKTLEELFEYQLKDLFSAEDQLADALPKMVENATDEKLKEILKKHLKSTMEHKSRIETICRELNIAPNGIICRAMQGLIRETESFIEEASDSDIMDTGLIAEAQRVAHYEISVYGTTVRYAKELGYIENARTLQSTLNDEYDADNSLDKLAENNLNRRFSKID